MKIWYDQNNYFWGDLSIDEWSTETYIEENDTIDLDCYGLTDDEIQAFNNLRKVMYYDTWIDYVDEWD